MTGMNQTLQTNNSLIVSSFKATLFHELLVVLFLLALLYLGWNALRSMQLRRAIASGGRPAPVFAQVPGAGYPEPAARRILRIGFGLIWLFDGLLQAQSQMPLGLATGVLQPAASSSPGWVQRLVDAGVTIWTNHPVPAAAASVWIQVGVGLFLLAAARGRWSQMAAMVSVGWALVVWGFGEAFGGIFGPGLTWAFGAPGAVVFYAAAGLLVALPERFWRTPALGRALLACMGAFFAGMAVLQAWPGRGFWQGQAHGAPAAGTLTGMVQQMAQTPQPGLFAGWVRWFGSFDAAHGWAVNLVLVVALGAIGVAFAWGRPQVLRWAVPAATVLCLLDWVLVEDLGFFGGTGTDPNSMIPMALVFVAGYVAMVRLPRRLAAEAAPVGAEAPSGEAPAGMVPVVAPAAPAAAVPPGVGADGRWWHRLDPGYAFRVAASIGSLAVVLLGTVPMAAAAVNPNADPVLAEALDGVPTPTDTPAPDFHLVDQHDRPVTLATLRGRTVALTFLDPVCNSDCPIIAQEMRLADGMLGSEARHVELVAVVANPLYRSIAYTDAFDAEEDMTGLGNWMFLTGSTARLQQLWNSEGVLVGVEPAGSMVAHSEITYIIDGTGHTRRILNEDQGSGPSDESSFTVELTDQIEQVLHS